MRFSLCYLPVDIGAALAVFANGQVPDWNYSRTCKSLSFHVDKCINVDMTTFPIGRAGLDPVWP